MESYYLEWQRDEESAICTGCSASFNVLRRRHHCRACGKIFCNSCCNYWILLPPEYHFDDPQRTCWKCNQKYSNLNYSRFWDVYGPPDAPTILILHGALANRMVHTFQVKDWSEEYRVICADLPGHGSRRNQILTMETAIQSVKQVIEEAVPQKKVLLFGYDLGGYVAMAFAQSYPEMCSGLVLGACCNETFGGVTQFLFVVLKTAFLVLPESMLWTLIPKGYSHVPREDLNEAILRSGMNYSIWSQCAATMKEPEQDYFQKGISSFSGPIFFINGELDDRKSEEKFLSSSKNGRLHIVRGASHLVHLEPGNRTEFSTMIKEFAKDIGWKKIQ